MRRPFRPNALRVLTMGLALIILLGALLLTLPCATRGGHLPFLDAVFTSASAACVTGLVLYDTYTQFTLFGQIVILCLIQIGGLGFMMVISLVSFLMGRRIGLYERSLLMESVGSLQIGGVVKLTRRALLGTALFEGAGALVLATWFCPRFGMRQGLWMAVFHSVSAFCNAGFDLMGIRAPGTSFTTAAAEPVVSLTLMALIVVGGLGFFLWDDVVDHRLNVRRYSLHTKIVLTATPILIVVGTLAFFLIERGHAFAGLPLGQQWLMSAFQSVSPRTAGFNTTDLTALSDGSTLLTIILMFIGAGSGSTGGGSKINTFAVLVLAITAYVQRRQGIDVFHRRLDENTVHKAFSSVSLYVTLCLTGSMILCLQGFPMVDSVYEAFSAMGTVGLTRGITPSLPTVSKLVITALMFAGRLGSLSVAMAMVRQKPQRHNITEKILIG